MLKRTWWLYTMLCTILFAAAIWAAGCEESSLPSGAVIQCRTDFDCPDGSYCDTSEGLCKPKQLADADIDLDEDKPVDGVTELDTELDKPTSDREEIFDGISDPEPDLPDIDTTEPEVDLELETIPETEEIEEEPPPGDPDIQVPEKLLFDPPEVGRVQQKEFYIENVGGGILQILEIGLTEDTPDVFSLLPLTSTNVWAGESVPVVVRFEPISDQPVSGKVYILSDDPDEPRVEVALEVSLCRGGGTINAVPRTIQFPAVEVGDEHVSLLTISNESDTRCINITEFFITCITGSEPCPFEVREVQTPLILDASESVQVGIAFAPELEDSWQAILKIVNDSRNDGQLTVYLSGRSGAVKLEAHPEALDFGEVNVGSVSQMDITLVNTGIAPVNIESVFLREDSSEAYSLLNAAEVAGTRLEPSEDAVLHVAFSPQEVGDANGAVVITSNATVGARIEVPLTGKGVQEAVVVEPPAVSFGNVAVGQTVNETITVHNNGSDPINLTAIGLDPNYGTETPFELAGIDVLPVEVASGEQFSFTVSFSPQTDGFFENRILIQVAERTSMLVVPVSGRGVVPILALSRADGEPLGGLIDFGEVVLETTATVDLIARNEGNADLEFYGVELVAPEGGEEPDSGFEVSYENLDPLAPQQERVFSVKFNSAPPGRLARAILVFHTNDPYYPDMEIELRAEVVAPQLAFFVGGVEVSEYNFGSILVGYQAGPVEIELRNLGYGTLVLDQISISGDGATAFNVEFPNVLPYSLRPYATDGDKLTIQLSFSPDSNTEYTASLDVLCNDYRGETVSIALYGTGNSCPEGWHDVNGIPDDGPRGDGCEYRCDYTNNGVEICDELDNDCDGETDEGFGVGEECVGQGICANYIGQYVCKEDHTGVECSANIDYAQQEICNGLDDDCDGVTDEEPESLVNCTDAPSPDMETHCENGSCRYTCPEGTHLCTNLGGCVSDDSVDHCGINCTPCTAPPHGIPVCLEGGPYGYTCDFECEQPAYERVGNFCRLKNTVDCCGESCTDCNPAPEHGSAACINGQCRYFCDEGYHHPEGDSYTCVENNTIDCCGPSCQVCSQPPNSTAACVYDDSLGQWTCTFECNEGYHGCPQDAPIACYPDASVATCGDRCEPCPTPVTGNGYARCVPAGDTYVCTIECNDNYHLCWGTHCLSDSDVNSCGDRCEPCPPPASGQGTPICVYDSDTEQYTCSFACRSGYHACENDCVNNCSVDHCGTRCEPCPTTEHGSVSCDCYDCQYVCDAGYHACPDGCFANDDPDHCGTNCVDCPEPSANGRAVCTNGTCGVECDPGYHSCPDDSECYANDDPNHCGDDCEVCQAGNHMIASCVNGECQYTCEENWYDWNNDPSDGCETYCVPTSDQDWPDDSFEDANCDGIDGTIDWGVFVAQTGCSDSYPGTKEQPVCSIARAFEIAEADPVRKHVYVAAGNYNESFLVVPDGVSIFGGYSATTNWSRSTENTTIIQGMGFGLAIPEATSPMVIDMLDIYVYSMGSASASNYGIWMKDTGTNVVLRNLKLNVASGENGISGMNGLDGNPGNPGSQGTNGADGGNGGAAGENFMCPEANGGAGGKGKMNNGESGQNSPGGATGGAGGAAPGGSGSSGQNGSNGNDGIDGAPGSAYGELVEINYGPVLLVGWKSGDGADGTNGQPGIGGAGGGGGAGLPLSAKRGGGGGGGGAGGCGGQGGQGGTGGGGSFGIFLVNSSPEIVNCEIVTSNGGFGGSGGLGGNGGAGAQGGGAGQGECCNAFGMAAGNGGIGGTGGNGGKGGGGGGGAGGASFCIFRVGDASQPSVDQATTDACQHGEGGAGGLGGGADNNGEDGLSGIINEDALPYP